MKITHNNSCVLVTGGAGFIGSHLVDALVDAGCEVRVLDNFRNGKRENLQVALQSGKVTIIEGDIVDKATCDQAVKGTVAVFHLACLGVRHSLHDPVENHQVNALGTLNLLESARRANVERFLYMSTSEVYGAALTFPLTEEATTWPTTVYGASKLAGEHYASAYHTCFGVPVVRVRTFNNYGPRAHFAGDSGEVIPRFILRALAGQPPVIFGDGSHTRDFLFVRDCAEALIKIAEADGLVGDLVNLGYGDEIRIDALAGLILAALGTTGLKAIHEADRPGDVPRLWVKPDKVRNATGFKPKTTPQSGLALTVSYYKALFEKDPHCLERMQTRNWEKA